MVPRDSAAGQIGFENDVERADHDHGLAQQEHHGGGEVAAASGGRPPPTEAVTTNINWFTSPFYLGNFFSKQPDNKSAKCNSCPISSATIKTKSGNTTGLDSHLSRKHRKVYETFLIKKAEVEAKRKEIQEKVGTGFVPNQTEQVENQGWDS